VPETSMTSSNDSSIRSVLVRSCDPNQMEIPVHSCVNIIENKVTALLDSGAQGKFIDESIVDRDKKRKLIQPIKIRNIDGTTNKSGNIKWEIRLKYQIADQKFDEWFYITNLGDQKMILGLPWLRQYNPLIDWSKGAIEKFNWKTTRSASGELTDAVIRFITTNRDENVNERTQAESYVEDIGWEDEENVWIRAKISRSQELAQEDEDKQEKVVLPKYLE
jgi:hypothetical protein